MSREPGPLVSYVMTAYRSRPEWLLTAVEAVLDDFGPIELILIDDGSPVPVADLLAGIEDDRLRIIRTENRGIAEARNRGIAESRAPYIRLVDDDDRICRGSTVRLLGHTAGSERVIAYGATLFCDAELNPEWKMSCGIQGRGAEAALLGRFTTRISAFLFPHALLERVGPLAPVVVAEDWDLLVRAMELAPVRGDRRPAYRYRRHPGGVTSDLDAGPVGARQVIERYLERNPSAPEGLRRRARATVHAQAARTYLTHGQLRRGLRELFNGLRDPRAPALQLRLGLTAALGRAQLHRSD